MVLFRVDYNQYSLKLSKYYVKLEIHRFYIHKSSIINIFLLKKYISYLIVSILISSKKIGLENKKFQKAQECLKRIIY